MTGMEIKQKLEKLCDKIFTKTPTNIRAATWCVLGGYRMRVSLVKKDAHQ